MLPPLPITVPAQMVGITIFSSLVTPLGAPAVGTGGRGAVGVLLRGTGEHLRLSWDVWDGCGARARRVVANLGENASDRGLQLFVVSRHRDRLLRGSTKGL